MNVAVLDHRLMGKPMTYDPATMMNFYTAQDRLFVRELGNLGLKQSFLTLAIDLKGELKKRAAAASRSVKLQVYAMRGDRGRSTARESAHGI